MVSRIKDITGIKFGSLTAIKVAYVKTERLIGSIAAYAVKLTLHVLIM